MTLKNIENYDITILNKQSSDGVTDNIEEKVVGSFRRKNGKSYIMYETEEEGSKTSSTVIAAENEVKIKRSGLINSEMLYRTDRNTSFEYKLPFGAMEMEIETHTIENHLTDNGGSLHLVYTLCIQGGKYYNDMTILIDKRE